MHPLTALTMATLGQRPDPAVYRRAAEFVQEGKDWHACVAISRATLERFYLRESSEEGKLICDLYDSQFAKAFGPESESDWFAYATGHHPFWNAPPTVNNPGEVVQHRVTALLLMAEMCENPVD